MYLKCLFGFCIGFNHELKEHKLTNASRIAVKFGEENIFDIIQFYKTNRYTVFDSKQNQDIRLSQILNIKHLYQILEQLG